MKTKHIKFSKCPVDPHKGGYWKKLDNIGENDEFILTNIRYSWSDDLSVLTIKKDTFADFKMADWRRLIKKFYGLENIFGLLLVFVNEQGNKGFTTFRGYNPGKHRYYEDCWDKCLNGNLVFKVKRT